MTTTRRSSSVQGTSSHQQTSLLLDSYEAFKRKHIQQNREIINKNSELNKEKADLQSQLALMRVERLSNMSTILKLNIQLEAASKKLERAHAREHQLVQERDRLQRRVTAHGIDPHHVHAMQQALVNAIAALQAFGLTLPAPPPALSSSLCDSTNANASTAAPSSSSPPASPLLADSLEAPEVASSSTSSASASSSRRASLAERGPRQSMCTSPPDLSNISEADASDEEREEQRMAELQQQDEDAMRRATEWQNPDLNQISAARQPSPSPPLVPTQAPTPISSTSTAPHTATTPLTRPTSRTARAPPKAPSASSHSTLSNAASSKRPARRVSGMLKPSLAVEFGEMEEGGVVDEKEEGEEPAVAVAVLDATEAEPSELQDSDDANEEEEEEEYVPPVTTVRSRRRVSSIGLDATTNPSLAVRTRVSRSRSSTSPAPVEPEAEQVPPPSISAPPPPPPSARPALAEIQAPQPPITVPTTTAKEKIVERMRRRTTTTTTTTRAPPPIDSDAGDPLAAAAAAHESAPPAAAAAVLASLSKAKAARRGTLAPAAQDDEEEVMAEVVRPSPLARSFKEVEPLEALPEGAAASEAAQDGSAAAEDAPVGGRRARKSVNYALPKLNTKMRRPEDYVPVKPGVTKPRKSTKTSTSAPRTSELPPPPPPPPPPLCSSSAAPIVTESDVDHQPVGVPATPVPAVPRTASLAGKKPPPSATSSSSSGAETLRDNWSEEQFLRRSSGLSSSISSTAGTKPRVISSSNAGTASSSQSQAGQDLEARRRQREAERDQLAKLGGSGGGGVNGSGRRQTIGA